MKSRGIQSFAGQNYKAILFSMEFILLMLILFGTHFHLFGDGVEYLGMAISFVNHFSPNLTELDYAVLKRITGSDLQGFFGYLPALDGQLFSIHFWAYSLLVAVFLLPVYLLRMNELASFVLANCALMLYLGWYILYSTGLTDERRKLCFLFFIVNPVLLYVPASHAEVWIYVFFSVGLIALAQGRFVRSVVHIALAALQNSTAAIIIPFILGYMICEKRPYSEVCKTLLAGAVSLLPVAFTFCFYHVPNILVKIGAYKIGDTSFAKVWSIFFDLNFGYVLYVPILLALLLFACIRLHRGAVVLLVILLASAVAAGGQINWNSGMVFINRYCIWFMPLLCAGGVIGISLLRKQKTLVAVLLVLYLLSTGGVLTHIEYFAMKGQTRYLEFSPVAKYVIRYVPWLYDPAPDIFVERAMHAELLETDVKGRNLKIEIFDTSGKLRKRLVSQKCLKEYHYENGEMDFSSHVDFGSPAVLHKSE